MVLTHVATLLLLVPRFEDVTSEAGLPTYGSGYIETTMGAPAAWIDWNGDGYPDLVVGNPGGPTQLFINDGGSLPFKEEVIPALATIEGVIGIDHLVVSARDVDPAADSGAPVRALVFVTAPSRGAELIVLALPEGGAPRRVPVGRPTFDTHLTTHGDLDGDGSHDIVTSSFACGRGQAPMRTVFRLDRYPAGYRLADDAPGFPAGGCWPIPVVTDYRGDGTPGVFVAPDYGPLDAPNYVLTGGALEALPGVYGMGVAIGDVNSDEVLDYAVSSVGPDLLWRSGPSGRVATALSRATEWGETNYRYKWGSTYGDFDDDGDLELWMTAGSLGSDEPGSFLPSEPNARDVLLADGVDVGTLADVDLMTASRTIALADFDRDGRLDAFVSGTDARTLFRNVTPVEGRSWVAFDVPDEPGAFYRVTACGRTTVREWSGGATGAAHEPLIHVGLGDCSDAVTVSVRWPWLYEQTYGPFAPGAIHTISGPGTVWVTPFIAEPGATVTVRSTLPGRVAVAGVAVEDGRASVTVPLDVGSHRLPVTVDERPVRLAPRVVVAAASADLLTDPWPLRRGVLATVTSMPPGAALVSGADQTSDGVVATAESVTFQAGEHLVTARTIAALASVVGLESAVVGGQVELRFAAIDGLGAAISPTLDARLEVGVPGREPTGGVRTLERGAAGWFHAALPTATGVAAVTFDGSEIARLVDPAALGDVDVGRSKLWVTTPIARADGSDVVEVALALRDANGRLIEPPAAYLPSAPGFTRIDEAWSASIRLLQVPIWTARLRVGMTPGLTTVNAGALEAQVLLVEPDPIPPASTESTLTRTDTHWELIPRDAFGQRLGSGVATSPGFVYRGVGVYERTRGPGEPDDLTVQVGSEVVISVVDGVTTISSPSAPSDSGCASGPTRSRTSGVAAALITLILLGLLRRDRTDDVGALRD
ncbi:MAG: hypothetical protein IV100_20465 [Myxococcales bacterium]|nr:hypothetical protein [Myxococcales bacterium]